MCELPSRRPAEHGEEGQSIIEALVAVIVLALVVLAFVPTMRTTTVVTAGANDQVTATGVADHVISQVNDLLLGLSTTGNASGFPAGVNFPVDVSGAPGNPCEVTQNKNQPCAVNPAGPPCLATNDPAINVPSIQNCEQVSNGGTNTEQVTFYISTSAWFECPKIANDVTAAQTTMPLYFVQVNVTWQSMGGFAPGVSQTTSIAPPPGWSLPAGLQPCH